eukprot:CAMPEP_0182562710 /NCGR_PEP_ID=MMETSP1324-20130603/5008_1 /TAXON_ID=236786 /ORGANISM="Florenciella sp., Strain RCC1587" /LENGTH=127 /DNA_ID=CAMNT_0024775729 /DNA_START=179 /DNA_END=562 /DNA_ORIENTATION=+
MPCLTTTRVHAGPPPQAALLTRGARAFVPKVALRPAVARPQIRKMSGHDPVQAEADMNAWVKISIGMAGATALVTAWVVYLESNHEHHHSPDRSFKKIRNKPLPWVCSDCSSGFDLECWAKCKADMK